MPKESYKTRIQAFCHECSGGERTDCEVISCPFYSLRNSSKREATEWWLYPKRQWNEVSELARLGKPLPPIDKKERTEAQIMHAKRMKIRLTKG